MRSFTRQGVEGHAPDGTGLESRGVERLREPGILVVANHPTLIDVLVLMSHMPQADCVVKQRYYDHLFLGGTARAAGYIPSRDGPGLIADCVERLTAAMRATLERQLFVGES